MMPVKQFLFGAVLCSFFVAPTFAQSVKDSLFREASESLEQARAVQADLLSPRRFAAGMASYNEAQERFESGRDLNSIKTKLSDAVASFKQATEGTELARVTMAALLKTRGDAMQAGATTGAADLWQDAEEQFRSIASDIERGRIKSAQRKLESGETVYREAELAAIKANYLDDTKTLLAAASRNKVERYAPKTLAKSKQLLAEAEKALTENRYDTDRPRSLAQQANYEANHALYLASQLQKVRNKQSTTEDLILDWQKPMRRVASAADLVPRFDNGYENATQELVEYIESLQKSNQGLKQDLQDRDKQISQMEIELAELEKMLGGVSQERVALSRRLEAQAIARQNFRQVEDMFVSEEAQVLRDSDNVVMRLVGLNFDSGESEIKSDNFVLLTKVQSAIRIFPRGEIIVEGHTDSYGGDENNMRLSEERAEAVRAYLLANMNINPAKITSLGFGETRPIANNETSEGREKNRRIDIVIIPARGDSG
ncbi:MAG: OmpA family protein [Pseudomonadota bacterium]